MCLGSITGKQSQLQTHSIMELKALGHWRWEMEQAGGDSEGRRDDG